MPLHGSRRHGRWFPVFACRKRLECGESGRSRPGYSAADILAIGHSSARSMRKSGRGPSVVQTKSAFEKLRTTRPSSEFQPPFQEK